MNKLPDIEDLRLFCSVVRNLNFSATAKELGFSPSYVTKRISLLEKSLRVRLLHRTTRQVTLSEDGRTVYRWALGILENLDQMTESLTTAKTTPRGLLRISTSSGFGRNRVAPVLSELVQRYPLLQVQLELLDRPVDLIGEGFDLDIRLGGEHEPDLIARRIATNSRVLCASPAYLERHGIPGKISDLSHHQCIVMRERDQSFGVWQLKGPGGIENVKVTGPLSANNGDVVHRWAIEGHGIILRSMWDVGSSLKGGHLVRVLSDYYQEADVAVLYPLRLTESAKVRACVQLLEEYLKNDRLSVR